MQFRKRILSFLYILIKTSGVFWQFFTKNVKKISIFTLAFGHFSYFRLSVLCKNTFVIFIHFIYQSLLLCALELFYMILPAHCLLFRGKVLEIDQLHRSACLCIFGTFPGVMRFLCAFSGHLSSRYKVCRQHTSQYMYNFHPYLLCPS